MNRTKMISTDGKNRILCVKLHPSFRRILQSNGRDTFSGRNLEMKRRGYVHANR